MKIQEHVERIGESLSAIREALESSSFDGFGEAEDAMVALESLMGLKAAVDARFAWLADQEDAGPRVGTTSTRDYLVRTLDISFSDAVARLRAASSLYGALEAREVKASDFEGVGATDVERETLMEKARREEQRRLEEDREQQARARESALRVKADKMRAIELELRNLNEHSNPSRPKMYSLAMEQAAVREVSDLRQWLREEVKKANRAGRTPAGKKDPLAAMKKREFWMSRPDSDGGVKIGGYLPGGMAAKLSAALAAGRNAGANTKAEPSEDNRTMGQRMADQLGFIAGQFLDSPGRARNGAGTALVITGTVKDFMEFDEGTRFVTNTGHELNALEVLLNGIGGTDYALVMNGAKKLPLAFAQKRRAATFDQKLVLAALETFCSAPGCTIPAAYCDIHHLVAFAHGGRTDIENLTLLCRNHHTDNNDQRDGRGGLGYFDRDNRTGDVGWVSPRGGPMRFNTSVARRSSPGHRVFEQATRDGPNTNPGDDRRYQRAS